MKIAHKHMKSEEGPGGGLALRNVPEAHCSQCLHHWATFSTAALHKEGSSSKRAKPRDKGGRESVDLL